MTIKVWGIIEGPIDLDEVDYEDEEDEDELPDDAGWFMVCKTEIDGKIEPCNFYFRSMDDAYAFQKHFYTSIEPLIIDDFYKEKMM